MPDPRNIGVAVVAAVVTCALGVVVGRWSLVAAVGSVAFAVAVSFSRHAVAQRRLLQALLSHSTGGTLAGLPVRLAPLHGNAFVAGLVRPTIFCDASLADELSGAEQRAVVLHERAHQLARDPLRMAAVAAISPVAGRFPAGRRWLALQTARREIAADRFALQRGVSPSAIASAITKVSPVRPAHVPGFSLATDLRLRALLGDDIEPCRRHVGRWLASGFLVGAVVCGAILDHSLSVLV